MKKLYLSTVFLLGVSSILVSNDAFAATCPKEIKRSVFASMRQDKNAQIEINGKKYKLHNPDVDQKSLPTYDAKVLNKMVKLDQAKTTEGQRQNPNLCVYTYRQWGKIITKPMFTFSLEEVQNQPSRLRGRTIVQPMNEPSPNMPHMQPQEPTHLENMAPVMEPPVIMEPNPIMQDQPMMEPNLPPPPPSDLPPPPQPSDLPPPPQPSDLPPPPQPSQGFVPPPPPSMPSNMISPPPSPKPMPGSASPGLNRSGEQSGSLQDAILNPPPLKKSTDRVLKEKPKGPLTMEQHLAQRLEQMRPAMIGNDDEIEDDDTWED